MGRVGCQDLGEGWGIIRAQEPLQHPADSQADPDALDSVGLIGRNWFTVVGEVPQAVCPLIIQEPLQPPADVQVVGGESQQKQRLQGRQQVGPPEYEARPVGGCLI